MIRTVQVNFTNGAISADVRNRLDNPIYRNSAQAIENCRLKPQGGVTARPGLAEIGALTVGKSYQVEEFIFSSAQAYVCIFYAGSVDIWDKNLRQKLLTVSGGPWTEGMIAGEMLQCTQQLDTMIICNRNFQTVLLKRRAYADFYLTTLVWDVDPNGAPKMPWHKYAPVNCKMNVSGFGPGEGILVAIDMPYFTAQHLNLWIRFLDVPLFITSVEGPQNVTCSSPGSWPGSPPLEPTTYGPDPQWDEQAFSVVHGWPQCTCFHEQRLAIGGGRDIPNAIWLSQTVGPFNFALGTGLDSEAIKYQISSDRVVEIRAMISQLNLQVFAGHAEFVIPWFGSTALTPANFAVKKQSGYGLQSVFARPFDQSTLFISRTANAVREFSPQVTSLVESYVADSISYLAVDLISDPVDFDSHMEGVAAQEANAYVINRDGTIAVLTRVKKENIGGWSQWTTQGKFLRCGVCDHEAWFLVERDVGGIQRIAIEVLDNTRMLDYSATWSGAATTQPGPFFQHFEAMVHVLSDGVYFGEKLVDSNGFITLPVAVTKVEVGYNFVPRVVPLVTEAQLPDGVSKGLPRRVVRTSCDFLNTGSARIGKRNLRSDRPQDDPSAATPLYTGPFEAFHLGWNDQAVVVVERPLPLGFTLRSMMQEVEV